MKFLAVVLMFSSVAFAAETAQNKTLPVSKEVKQVQSDKAKAALGKKEEDCDDKAKKPIEIKAESISLGGGNTGCTLE